MMDTYEKKYNEVLERVNVAYKDGDKHLRATLERIFPELIESEDERIRKTLIGWVNLEPSEVFDNSFSKEKILAWLEKQGEQKPIDKVELRFKVGDWITIKE